MQSGFRVFGTMVSYARIRGFRFTGLTVFLQRKIHIQMILFLYQSGKTVNPFS